MSLPLVSIVIPSYKPAHFEQCLRSAIGQTYPNIEILVSDNCPTDAIETICRQFPSVIYQRCPVKRTDNVLAALFSAKGELIKPLFDDDLLHPFCVERMVAALRSASDVELVFSASQVINIDNQRTETRRPYEAHGSLTGREMHRIMTLGMRNFVGEFSSILFRREKLWKIGTRDMFRFGGHDFTSGLADLAFYCQVAEGGSAFYIDEELTYFRRDDRLASNSNASANPDFGYCFSDYIDLLVASYATGVITAAELAGMREQVQALAARLGAVFPQVSASCERYLSFLETLQAKQTEPPKKSTRKPAAKAAKPRILLVDTPA
jgi:glycosyltransferase involved in cell wall biosynthesis